MALVRVTAEAISTSCEKAHHAFYGVSAKRFHKSEALLLYDHAVPGEPVGNRHSPPALGPQPARLGHRRGLGFPSFFLKIPSILGLRWPKLPWSVPGRPVPCGSLRWRQKC